MTKPEFFAKPAFAKEAPVLLDGTMHMFVNIMPGLPGTESYNFMNAKTGETFRYVDDETGEMRLPTRQDLETLLANDRLKPISMTPAGLKNPLPVTDDDIDAIIELDKKACARQKILQILDDNPVRLSDAELLRLLEEHREEILGAGVDALPHPSTVRRWMKRRGATGHRPLKAMVNMSGRVWRKRSFDPRTESMLTASISRYWTDEHVMVTDVIDEVQRFVDTHNEGASEVDQLKRPSDDTIRRRLRNSETAELYKQKFGEKAARTKYRTPYDQRLRSSQILEVAIVDHTVIDTMLVLSAKDRAPLGRPTLALMVDVASRCILAYFVTFGSPSLFTVTQLMKRSLRPKPHLRKRFPEAPDAAAVYGLTSSLVYDRAIETIGVSHRDALADIGVELIHAGAGEPQAKGIVERLFRTLNQLLFHRLSGSVQLPASLMREMGYDPSETAVLTIEELDLLIEEAINVYHYQLHSALGISPIQYWTEQAERGITTLPDVSILDKMMGMVATRTLARNGIRLFHLDYCCEINVPILLDALAAKQRTQFGKRKGSVTATVKVKFNPENIGVILVFNPADGEYYELKCMDPEYANGTSLWQHNEIRKFAKSRGNRFRTPEERREMRLSLTRSIEEACPEIKLKARKAQKRFQDEFLGSIDGNAEPFFDEDVDLGVTELPVELAVTNRGDDGLPQHSPQRGKSSRARKSSKRSITKPKPAVGPNTSFLLTMNDAQRANAVRDWDMGA
jgi:putative transposase